MTHKLDLSLSLEERLRIKRVRLRRLSVAYAFSPYPRGDMAQDAFDSEQRELEYTLDRLERIIDRRYGG